MPSFGASLLGTKPTVPDLPSLSLDTEQQKALAANIAAVGPSEQIATKVDLFNQSQINKMLSKVIPNYAAITGAVSKNIAALSAGQVPGDVQAQEQQSAAARSLGGGYGGTEAAKNLVARDLGLTSLDLTQKGLSSAESWIKTMDSIYSPGNFNVSSMFVTPGQQASFDVEERNAQFQRQWMQNQIAAQPAMWAQDLKEAVQTAISIYSHTPPSHAGTLPVQQSTLSPYVDQSQFPMGQEPTGGGQDINVNFGGGTGQDQFDAATGADNMAGMAGLLGGD